MKLDTKFSKSRSENERLLEEEKARKLAARSKIDNVRYGDDGYMIEEPEPEPVRQPIREVRMEMPEQKPVRKPAKKPVKTKRTVGSGFLWFVLLIATIAFVVSFWQLPMFTTKIRMMVAGAAGVLLLVTGAVTSILSPHNLFQKTVNVLLSIAMVIAAVFLPYVEGRISAVLDELTGNKVRISMYALTTEYKQAHAPKYEQTINIPDEEVKVNLKDYMYAVYGSFTAIDRENQEYALNEMAEIFGEETPYRYDYPSARQAVEALYNNEVDIVLMSDSFVSMIEETEGYETFSQDTQILYTFTRTIETELLIKKDASLTSRPYTIFFGGNDEEGELSISGRTDVDMVVSVNPQSGQISVINVPRDAFIPNPYYYGEYDKLTHLGIYGLDNTLKGLGKYLDVKIDYYVLVNFTTFMKIIEALGGIDIENPYAFDYTWDDYSYPEGKIHLDGQAALYYVRERYNLPDGDFGRSMHQQIVFKAIIKKLTSPALVTNFNSLLSALEGTFLTDLSSNSFYTLCQKQLEEGTDWNIVNYHIEGAFGDEITASDPYNELSVVYPYPNQTEFVKDVIDRVYAGEILEQEDMPDGYFSYGD